MSNSNAGTSQKASNVRVRFAPSPTGYLHVGGARTVLYNWLFAKHMGGKLIIRVEDTDQVRSTREHEQMQIEDIKWLGLDYAEGPDVGGPYAPYRQSERLDIYAKYSKELLDSDRAYHCFCTDELLTQKREAAMKMGVVPQYDGTCLKVSKDDAQKRLAAGETATVRFKAPLRDYTLPDAVRGEVVFPRNMVGDFVILRNNGMPVYNFCCVIDDYLMKISHVLRAEEHLSNTVRQMMIYESFGWSMPVFAHCSLILGSDRTKLSKRHGATSVHQYAEEGFLPDALLNFLALLGWSSPDHKEILTLDEIAKNFDLERLNKAPSVFDPVKLRWMNGEYIRKAPVSEITKLVTPYLEKAGMLDENSKITQALKKDSAWLDKAIETVRVHFEVLADAPKFMEIFAKDEFLLEEEAKKICADPAAAIVVGHLKKVLGEHLTASGETITAEAFAQVQDKVKADSGQKGKLLFMPMRIALTGATHGPELKLVIPLLGVKRALNRIEHFERISKS